ncbi:MAG: hypothetical protein H7Y60_13515 [Rhodospirillaceae bacterium]|nr:hypothetical protein [Rhodospirillales bacterium]
MTPAATAFTEGNRLRDLGHPAQAAALYRRALAADPAHVEAHRNLLLSLLFSPESHNAERFAEHRRFAENFAPAAVAAHDNCPDPHRRLRIGYLSCHFAGNPVGRAVEPLFTHCDRKAFAPFCYAELDRPDGLSARFRSLAEGWRAIDGLSDAQVTQAIRDDGIDILVCLAGHLDRNRPLVAAYRPAPIQISYHDAATSGLDAMDYLLTDGVLSPRDVSERFTERLIRLPVLAYMAPPAGAPECGTRAAGPLMFGCFNAPAKLSPPTLEAWAALLHRVPHSRLLLRFRDAFADPALRRQLHDFFAGRGIGADRLDLRGDCGADHPLAIYREVDITLDPHPFSGSTVTFESLWMGVPVVSWPGDAMVGRWSAALLGAVGLRDLIASGAEDYVARAAALAAQSERRDALRADLRPRIAASSLCDGPAKTRQIERLYRAFWRRWCNERTV